MDAAKSSVFESFGPPHPDNLYIRRAIAEVNSHGEGLWDHLERVSSLDPAVGRAVLSHLLELACVCQNMGNIQTGRYGIAKLPREWVLANIEAVAEQVLSADDDWAYRRLLELYQHLDAGLMQKLARRAIENPSPDIREAGRSFLDLPTSARSAGC